MQRARRQRRRDLCGHRPPLLAGLARLEAHRRRERPQLVLLRGQCVHAPSATVPGLADLVSGWYRSEWWDRLGLTALPQDIANEIFEQSVNLGKGGAGKKVQLVCNAFNRAKAGNSLFADLAVDGVIGPRTLDALAALLARRTDEKALVHALNCMQGAHYIELAARNPSQRKFTDGWMKRTHCPD